MSVYEKHVFICENERDSKNPIGCCVSKGSREVSEALKKRCNDAGLKGKVRVNKAGCLGQCAKGTVLAVYPEGTWYQNVVLSDVEDIFTEHIVNNRVVERLELKKDL